MRRASVIAALAVMGIAGTSWAQNSSADDRTDLSVTIYQGGFALVHEQRRVELDQGRIRLELADVSARVDPTSVLLQGADLRLVEQNFDYDLLSPLAILRKSIGQEVTFFRPDPNGIDARGDRATVLAANDGVVLKTDQGIETLSFADVPGRIGFDALPDALRPRPTLSMIVESGTESTRDLSLTYLTEGLTWRADYVATLNSDSTAFALQGLVTLNNSAGTTFNNAAVKLVAGQVNRAAVNRRARRARAETAQLLSLANREDDVAPEAISGYYLYPLPERTDMAQNQTKQIGFLSRQSVEARKLYRYSVAGFRSIDTALPVTQLLTFDNDDPAGLGVPLPGGIFRVYTADSGGQAQFLGEDRLIDTPVDQPVEITLGKAFDVTAKPVVISNTANGRLSSGGTQDVEMRYLFANAGQAPVTVEFRQQALPGDTRVLEENIASVRDNANRISWTVPIPAQGETELRFKLRLQR